MKKFLCVLSAVIIAGTAVFGSVGSAESTVSAVTYTAKAKTTKTKTTAQKFDTKITASEVVSQMQVGYNIGNGLDAYGSNDLSSETSWSHAKITKEYVDALKKKGFKTIRIPVTWYNHLDSNYNIDSKWLDRVKEVVDYAIDDDTYVIINMHHDNSIYDIEKCLKSTKDYSAVEKRYTKVWKQIAAKFKGYDEHLIFESMNEPRIEGSANEWSGGTKQERNVINKLNSAFVKTIRATKGNNTYRFLMIPGYAASSSDASLNDVKIPDDKRIIFSVHAYSPYFFAFDENASSTFSKSDENQLLSFFETLNNKFVKKGIPVVIGEMGCINKNNTAERVKWAKFYTENAAKYNITCIWWDNNAFGTGSENFGMVDRKTGKFKYPEIAKALIEGSERN